MVPLYIKDIYWDTVGQATRLNLYLQKILAFARIRWASSPLFLNLGSGRWYIPNFVNIDGNLFVKKDLWLDIRHGLPFRSNSVSGIYACHVLEHFHVDRSIRILRECFRSLRPGAGIRIVTPSLEKAIEAYVKQDIQWFSDWPDKYSSLGGRFNNYLLCRDQHRVMYDFSLAEELLRKVGFSMCQMLSYGSSLCFPQELLSVMEPEERREFIEKSMVAEAVK